MMIKDGNVVMKRTHDDKNIIICYKGNKIIYRYTDGLDIVYYDENDKKLHSITFQEYKLRKDSINYPIGLVVIPAELNENGKTTIMSLPIMSKIREEGHVKRNGYDLDGSDNSYHMTFGDILHLDNKLAVAKGIVSESDDVKHLMNGKDMSNAMLNLLDQDDDSPVSLCNKFKTKGTQPGDWYLPSFGQLYKLYTLGIHRFARSLQEIGEDKAYWPDRDYSTFIRFDSLWSSTITDPNPDVTTYLDAYIITRPTRYNSSVISIKNGKDYATSYVRAFADVELAD